MAVLRIVTDIAAEDIALVRTFYEDLLDLQLVMDQGWIVTLASDERPRVQLSIASEGGAGAPVPDMSIEVDDVDAVYARAKEMGADITHDLRDEPWGVRRFFVRDPVGKLLNILSHTG